jgi:LCP family protein required for cell wall assembly
MVKIIQRAKRSRRYTSILIIIFALVLMGASSLSWLNQEATRTVATRITVLPHLKLAQSQGMPSDFMAVLNQKGPYLPLNILLLGSDTRAGQGSGFGHFEGARSDTIMLLHLNAQRNATTILSFPRDLSVPIPACSIGNTGGSSFSMQAKINSAFAVGGANCTVETLTELTGVPIQHVIIVDFNGFRAIVDAIGGLNVCLATPINDTEAKITLPAGEQQLTGAQALGLARARYSLADGSDLARIKRQQAIILLVAKQIKDEGFLTDPRRLFRLGKATVSALSVDPSLATLPALAGLARQVRAISPSDVQTITVPYLKTTDGLYEIDHSIADPIFEAFINDTAVPGAKPHTARVSSRRTPVNGTSLTIKSGVCAHPLF